MLARYKDSRFVSDKIFSFYALNYIIRNRNASAGQFFLKSYHYNGPESLGELQELIEKGNTSFVNSLVYWNQRIKGSSPYWYKKRCELYNWINHHIEQGNGAPTFFITLSCAECMWKDVTRLIRERLIIAGLDASACHTGSPKLSEFLNDYSIVVQECFQERVRTWMQTVGRRVFGIKFYWIRYEFAPGRGQIHAHLLAITENQDIYSECYKDLKKNKNGNEVRAQRLAAWTKAKFGLTASVEDNFDEIPIDNSFTPMHQRFSEIPSNERSSDIQRLMKHVQVHECSGFCLRKQDCKEQ